MGTIDVVGSIVRRYKTIDPFCISEKLKIKLMVSDMGEVDGCYLKIKNQKFIILNEKLEKNQINYVLAHELGHALLHKEMANPHFMSFKFPSNLEEEKEAHEFARELLKLKGE